MKYKIIFGFLAVLLALNLQPIKKPDPGKLCIFD